MISINVDLDEGAWNDPIAIVRQSLELAFGPVRIMLLPVTPKKRKRSASEVVALVAYEMGLSAEEMTGDSRFRRIARARFAACWIAHSACGSSLSEIGRALGGRDHKTVVNGLGRAAELRDSDPAFRMVTSKIAAAIRGGRA